MSFPPPVSTLYVLDEVHLPTLDTYWMVHQRGSLIVGYSLDSDRVFSTPSYTQAGKMQAAAAEVPHRHCTQNLCPPM